MLCNGQHCCHTPACKAVTLIVFCCAIAIPAQGESLNASLSARQQLLRSESKASAASELANTADGEPKAEDISRAKSFLLERELKVGQNQWLRAWPNTVEWLKKEGARVNPYLNGTRAMHSGFATRSVTTSAPMRLGDTLLIVPKKLWIHLDNFPTITDAPGPPNASQADAQMLRLAVALASEARKGTNSFWEPYLRWLPTLSDFTAFHPQLAPAQLLSDFGALRISRLVRALERVDNRLAERFAAWRQTEGHPKELDALTWDDMRESLLRLRTRRFSVEGSQSALIPGADLLNTALGHRLNTKWAPEDEGFTISATRALNGSEEVFIDYCSDCDNSKLLATWGMYWEGNPNALQMKHAPDCLSTRSPLTGQMVSLRDVTEVALEISSDDLAQSPPTAHPKVAPRCKSDVLESDDQGLIRCSLARLAWEYCGDVWKTLTTS